MPTQSELIYDRLVADEKLKEGSKYERLAALVYKVMDANADVVHHVILRATGKESDHEIDVAVHADGADKTMLIECRVRARKVIKGEVRDFFGKLHQLKPDVGILLSPQGFTRGAVTFAKDEGIVLAEFRPVRDDDSWVQTVRIEAHYFLSGDPTIYDIEWADADEARRLERALGTGTALRVDPYSDVRDEDGQSLGELRAVMTEAMKATEKTSYQAGAIEDELRFPAPRTIEFNGVPARVAALRYRFEVYETVDVNVVRASGVAEMLLHHVTGPDAGQGRVFFDEHFKALTFDVNRRVVRAKP